MWIYFYTHIISKILGKCYLKKKQSFSEICNKLKIIFNTYVYFGMFFTVKFLVNAFVLISPKQCFFKSSLLAYSNGEFMGA